MAYLMSPPTSPPASFDVAGVVESIGRHPRHDVRLELDVLAGRWEIETDQRASGRDAVQRLRSGKVLRHWCEVRPLVLSSDGAPQLNSPRLIRACSITNRFEWDRHFDGPAALESPGLRGPHRIPIGVGSAFVDDRVVGPRAERICIKRESAAAVVEGIEHGAEVIVLAQPVRVATELVRDPLVGWRRVPASARHVDVLVVVRDPHVAALRLSLAEARRHLDETAEWFLAGVHIVVEHPVDFEWCGELDGAHGRLAGRGARDDLRRNGPRRAVDR